MSKTMLIKLQLRFKDVELVFSALELLTILQEVIDEKIVSITKKTYCGQGSRQNPFYLKTINDYFLVAQQELSATDHNQLVFFNFAKRLIACNLQNRYMTDWSTFYVPRSVKPLRNAIIRHAQAMSNEADHETIITQGAEYWIISAGRNYSLAMQRMMFLTMMMLMNLFRHLLPQWSQGMIDQYGDYFRAEINAYGKIGPAYPHFQITLSHLDRKQNRAYAQQMRAILAGAQLKNSDYNANECLSCLPVLTATMFLAETARNPMSLFSALILLDFLEHHVIYGSKGNKDYTWEKILWATTVVNKYDAFGKSRTIAEWGGKFPMAHYGSYEEQKHVGNKITISEQKTASLLIRWLALKLKKQKNHVADVKVITKLSRPTEAKPATNVYRSLASYKSYSAALATFSTPKAEQRFKRLRKIKKPRRTDQQFLKKYRYYHSKQMFIDNLLKPTLRTRLDNFEFQLQSHNHAIAHG